MNGVAAGWVCALVVCVAGCLPDGGPSQETAVSSDSLAAVERAPADADGQLIYVPVYSHIFVRSVERQMNLTATLSVRNLDLRRPITILSVDYYDSQGAIVRRYLEEPVSIGPLSSEAYVVEEVDTRGGVGANFIVEWSSREWTEAPLIQAVMLTTESTQGISFITEGYPIRTREGDVPSAVAPDTAAVR